MFDDTKIDAFIKQVLDNLPGELTQIKQDLEKNIRAAMRVLGGDFKRSAPHPIPHLASFKEDFIFWRTNCSS